MSDFRTRCRLLAGSAVLILAMLGLGVRLAFLHLGTEEGVRRRVESRRSLERTLVAQRGNIFDCRGDENILALNMSVKDVCADPTLVISSNCIPSVSYALSQSLDLPVDAIAVQLDQPGRRYTRLRRAVPEAVAAEIGRQDLPGIFFRDANVRFYPHRSFLCHVLGFVDAAGAGCAGVELVMDRYLKGSPGLLETRVNALRQELYAKRDRYVPPLEGGNVVLTINQNVQYIVERALDKAMATHNAKGACAIVQRVATGEILAMASRPAFDLNRYGQVDRDAWLNRTIGLVYEPGSTMKAAVIAAVLNEGLVTPSTIVDCENGYWLYARRPLRDSHSYGKLSVADVLKKSSNIGSAKLALALGDRRIEAYFRRFGIGSPLGIDLPGEEAGIFAPSRKWPAIKATRVAIGQGVAVTALQMLAVFATIANDGYLMKPYVIHEVRGPGGNVLSEWRPQVLGRPISPSTAATMRLLLVGVTEEGGTGRNARVPGIAVAGKTGTAQKAVAGGYSSTDYVASFAGFLPADDPELAIIVVVDEPQPVHYGGVVAAPTFSEIAGQAIRCLDVPPVRHVVARR